MVGKQARLIVSVLLFACALRAVADAADAAARAFDRGTSAYQAGDYEAALTAFLEARRDGLDAPQVGYDLGVVYYRLGRYGEARHEFESLGKTRALAALSHYNLGLIAMRQHDLARARREFGAALSEVREPALRDLIAAALQRADAAPAGATPWTLFTEAAAGYDSNVALTSESTVFTPAHRGSGVYSLLVGGVGQLTGDRKQGLQAVGTFYRTDYPSVSLFNQSYLHFGAQYRWTGQGWNRLLGLYAGDLTLGGAWFETLATLDAEASLEAGPRNDLHAFYRYTRVYSGSDYSYLGGWHQALGIDDTYKLEDAELSFGYTLDFNERNNFNGPPGDFFSASPTDNGLFGRLGWRLSDTVRAVAELDYQHSHYEGADTVTTGGKVFDAFREENWWNASLGFSYTFSDNWKLSIDCSFADNRSNIPQFSYHSNQVMSSLEYVFAP